MKRRIEQVTLAVRETLASQGGRRVIRSTVLLLGCTGVSQLCMLGIALLVDRQLGPAALGMLLFALNVQSYLALFSGAGTAQVLMREVAADRLRTDEYVSAYLVLVGGTTLALAAVAFVVLRMAPLSADERSLLAWVLAGNVAASMNLLPLYDVQHKQARAGMVTATADVAVLGCVAASAAGGWLRVPLVGVAMAAKWALIFLGQLLVYHVSVRPLRWSLRPADLRSMGPAGWQVLAAVLLMLVPMNGGVILTRALVSETETALIGVAAQVAAVYFLFVGQTSRVLQPHVLGPHGTEGWFVRRLVVGYGGVLVAVGLGLGLVGGQLIPLAFSEALSGAIVPMAWMLVGGFCVAVGLILSQYLLRLRRERLTLAAHASAVACFLGLGIWLGRAVGASGVAAACAVSCALGMLLQAAALFACRWRSGPTAQRESAAGNG